MYKILSRCPVCSNKLKAIRLRCNSCNTVIDNEFELSKFDYLNSEQLYFIETFIRCRGSIKEVEKEMGISYPTVRAKLGEVIESLGYSSKEIIDALGNTSKDTEAITSKRYDDKFLKVDVLSHEGDKVNVKLPVKVVKEVIKVAGKLPISTYIQGMDEINIDELMNTLVSCLDNEVIGEIVDICSSEGDTVKIVIE